MLKQISQVFEGVRDLQQAGQRVKGKKQRLITEKRWDKLRPHKTKWFVNASHLKN